MARILDKFLATDKNALCSKYADAESFFQGLVEETADAIRCLLSKVAGSIYKIGKSQSLTDEDIEELVCDSLTTFLQKVKEGKYVFQGFDPASFTIEIAKNKSKNIRRSLSKFSTTDIQEIDDIPIDSNFSSREEAEKLEQLIAKLDQNCQKLIRLKYLEEYKDIEVIENKLTQYTTVDSLKNHRSKCLKKLVELGSMAI